MQVQRKEERKHELLGTFKAIKSMNVSLSACLQQSTTTLKLTDKYIEEKKKSFQCVQVVNWTFFFFGV